MMTRLNNKDKFTAEEKVKAIELYRSGLSGVEVGRKVGASAYSVRYWAKAAGVLRGPGGHPRPRTKPRRTVGKKNYPPEEKARAIELYRGGLSAAQVAKRVGVSAYSVRQWAARFGVGVLRGPRPHQKRRPVPKPDANPALKNYINSQLDELGLGEAVTAMVKVSIEQKLKAAVAKAMKETLEALE